LKWLILLLSLNAYAGDPACSKGLMTLRKGPGTNFPISWKVPKYMPFMKLETKNGWVKVEDFERETHWARPTDLTSANQCVVVKSAVATLRQTGSAASPPADLKTVDRFTPFKKLEADREWIHVEDETGRQAWIHETNVWKPVKIQSVTF
jgi:SH3-like domain-containing protein